MRHITNKTPAQVHTRNFSEPLSAQAEKASILLGAIFAASLGLFLIYGSGIANSNTLHNAAHDSRHAFGFPCH